MEIEAVEKGPNGVNGNSVNHSLIIGGGSGT